MNIPIFIVSVENSERYHSITKHYSSEDFKNVNISATLPGNKLDFEKLTNDGFYDVNKFISYKIYDYKEKKINYGTFGCAYGHMMVYKKIIEEDIKECIIIEDNVLLDNDYLQELNDFFLKLNHNNIEYDIIHLHSFRKNDDNRKIIIDEIYKGHNECSGTKMYYLNNKTAKLLFTHNFPIINVSDGVTCIPSRNDHYNLKTIYYCFKSISLLKTGSIRRDIDEISKKNYEITNNTNEKLANYKYMNLILNDEKIKYKLNDKKNTKIFLYKMNEMLQYKIVPMHSKYYLNCTNKNKLVCLFIKILYMNKIKMFDFQTDTYYETVSLLINEKYEDLHNFVYSTCYIESLLKFELLNIIERLKQNYKIQCITTMIKCSNYDMKIISESENVNEKVNNLKFGKLYVTYCGNMFLYFCFQDKILNDSEVYFEIGDIIMDNNSKNIENYSDSIIENIELLQDI